MMLGTDAFGARLEHASCSFGATTGQPIHSHSQITSFKRRGPSRNWRALTLLNPPSQGEACSGARTFWPYQSCEVSEHGACTMLARCSSGAGIKPVCEGHRLSLARAGVNTPSENAKANGKVTVAHGNANGVSVSAAWREVRHAGI
jgi:hypothetical protein